MKRTVAVILAGGSGERLWPLSRTKLPKQLVPLFNQKSLLMAAVERAQLMVPKTDIYIVASKALTEQIAKHINLPKGQFIIEPQARGTAGAVSAICHKFVGEPDTTVILCNSDHIIKPEKKFVNATKLAARHVSQEKMAVIGIKPSYPETNFGYIVVNKKDKKQIKSLVKFHEKPLLPVAKKYFKTGAYWNSGYFVFTIGFMTNNFKKQAPKFYQAIVSKNNLWSDKFLKLPKTSIDYLIIEKIASKIDCVSADVSWWDVGLWRSMFNALSKVENNPSGSVIRGPVVEISGNNNVLINTTNGLLGVTAVKDHAVIVTENAVLVCPLAESDKVRDLVNYLKNNKDYTKYL